MYAHDPSLYCVALDSPLRSATQREGQMDPYETLREQILTDIENLAGLEVRLESVETECEVPWDHLESGLQIKVAIYQRLEKERGTPLFDSDDEGYRLLI